MPTFSAPKTTIQLSVADLGRVTTPNPSIQQSFAASESIRNASQEFARASKDGTLTETPLETEDGRHMRFLGKVGTMPFFMVHAGQTFFDTTTTEKRNRRAARIPLAGGVEGTTTPTAVDLGGGTVGTGTSNNASIEPNPKYNPPLVPHALCLTVFLSPLSFVRTTNAVTGKSELNDVKIDVYFNGALCGSHYVPRRFSGEAFTMTEHIVRFTGRRIRRLIEKPWVIVPSGQTPDGDLREHRRGKVAYVGAQQRWNDISDSLIAEADKIGRDEKGNRPVTGEYLESLAELSMPAEIEDMQKAGGPKFGVLDVVILWGKGNKDGPDVPYIVEPNPIRIEGCTSVNPHQSMHHHHSAVQTVTRPSHGTNTAVSQPQSRAEALANARSIDDHHPTHTSPTQSITSTQVRRIPTTTTTNNPNPASVASSSRPNKPSSSVPAALLPLPFETPIKRSRGPYYDILTTKQTLCEEMDSIATTNAAIFDLRAAGYNNNSSTFPTTTNARTTRARYKSTAVAGSSSPLSSAPATGDNTPAPKPQTTKVAKLKGSSPPEDSATGEPGTSTRVVGGGKEVLSSSSSEGRIPAFTSRRREGTAGTQTQTQTSNDVLDRGFVVPKLSVDCSTTYAASGIVRNVGAARGGVFKEGGVVMGARFVVGG